VHLQRIVAEEGPGEWSGRPPHFAANVIQSLRPQADTALDEAASLVLARWSNLPRPPG
jgi:hypothetical protein